MLTDQFTFFFSFPALPALSPLFPARRRHRGPEFGHLAPQKRIQIRLLDGVVRLKVVDQIQTFLEKLFERHASRPAVGGAGGLESVEHLAEVLVLLVCVRESWLFDIVSLEGGTSTIRGKITKGEVQSNPSSLPAGCRCGTLEG
jgi:hypothetical protein